MNAKVRAEMNAKTPAYKASVSQGVAPRQRMTVTSLLE
jgi:hypothetical protein